jgi:hypothetical protein
MVTPSRRITPASGSTRRLMQRSSVDLPAPEGPMMNTASAPSTRSETDRSA